MTYQPPFDETGFIEAAADRAIEGIERERAAVLKWGIEEEKAALRSRLGLDTDTIANVMQADQVDAEIEATAGRIGKFYERLVASGMSKRAAYDMTATYGTMVVSQHFGVDVPNTFGVGISEDM